MFDWLVFPGGTCLNSTKVKNNPILWVTETRDRKSLYKGWPRSPVSICPMNFYIVKQGLELRPEILLT